MGKEIKNQLEIPCKKRQVWEHTAYYYCCISSNNTFYTFFNAVSIKELIRETENKLVQKLQTPEL